MTFTADKIRNWIEPLAFLATWTLFAAYLLSKHATPMLNAIS